MADSLRGALPPIYQPLLDAFFDQPKISETRATCDQCAMCDRGEPSPVPMDFEAHVPDVEPEGGLESETSERSRITVPPARRRRSPRSKFRALLAFVVVLGGLGAAGWYRYPAACEHGWHLATTQLGVWQRALEYQWSLGMRALGRCGTECLRSSTR